MRIVDLISFVAILVVVVAFGLIIARQRYMLRSAGGIALAVRRGTRWQYGIGRYVGDELQWFRALGVGTRPTRSLRRSELRVIDRRSAADADLAALPATAVVVECRDSAGTITIGLAQDAYTGFVSWLESSAPRS
jgi:Protein of unknown function (DUF2550)